MSALLLEVLIFIHGMYEEEKFKTCVLGGKRVVEAVMTKTDHGS